MDDAVRGRCRQPRRAPRPGGGPARPPRSGLPGNVDEELLRTGNPEQVAAATRACVEAGGGRRHVVNLSHGVDRETPVANFEAFVREVRDA